jgi:hypothetical protein
MGGIAKVSTTKCNLILKKAKKNVEKEVNLISKILILFLASRGQVFFRYIYF